MTKAYEDMSDEEFLNAPAPVADDAEPEDEVTEEQPEVEVDETPDVEEDTSDTDSEDEPEAQKEQTSNTPEKDVEEEDKEPSEVSTDPQAEYAKLLAPFKANGQDFSVKNVDEAIKLMQMGANYNKKMTGLKPSLRILKLLENHGLLDEDKLGYLIDLDKRNPGAISKLVSESGIDPLEIDEDKAKGYKPNTYTVDDKQLVFDEVIRDIQESGAFSRTAQIISSEWDAKSREVFASDPRLIKVINDQVESGVYDVINKELTRKRMLGELVGVSDLDAYRQTGNALQASGGLAHLNVQRQANPSQQVSAPKAVNTNNDSLNAKRKAAAPTKAAPTQSNLKVDFNPLEMSDEEFAKFDYSKLRK